MMKAVVLVQLSFGFKDKDRNAVHKDSRDKGAPDKECVNILRTKRCMCIR